MSLCGPLKPYWPQVKGFDEDSRNEGYLNPVNLDFTIGCQHVKLDFHLARLRDSFLAVVLCAKTG